MAGEQTKAVLTPDELKQCYYGIEFVIKDFRKARADGVVKDIMSEQEANNTEGRLSDLKAKLLAMYYENGGQ